ncbi:peroxiredoxin [Methylopila jiangsuensis]|uniref:thioredoxin-dependent peroxiredoxin n=1 Tax=Methylopila jiangsuensis TaxID=586230 RepID=A0A9W6JIL3_9HYPH|nr:peroxiredoxin [Methylopila jiangsuensis]MDR6286746.1 peroxiredoxin Q/BCP [Methylopila jiangsuensis]GLK76908.1 peroxiredoxin [Methylopila jiangsuensis]
MSSALTVGAPAPDFTLPATGGDIRLGDLKGRKVVLYFYPKDDTSGCTREAIAFNGLRAEFAAAGAEIIGVSPDGLASHDAFREKYGLEFPLASDAEKAMLKAYGAYGEKNLYGKISMGVIRATVLIDAEGRVARVWPKVKVDGHAEEVLAAAKAL